MGEYECRGARIMATVIYKCSNPTSDGYCKVNRHR